MRRAQSKNAISNNAALIHCPIKSEIFENFNFTFDHLSFFTVHVLYKIKPILLNLVKK